jgi:hypothetical protein
LANETGSIRVNLPAISNPVPDEALKKEVLMKRNKIEFNDMWKFNGPYKNLTKYLRKSRNGINPNKLVVALCWLMVIIGIIIAFLKIVFRAF